MTTDETNLEGLNLEPPTADHSTNMSYVRPRNQDNNLAFWAPERDVALQGNRILGEVELLLMTDRYLEHKPVFEALRALYPSGLSPEDELRKAGMACVEFLADCWGRTYVPGKSQPDWPKAEQVSDPVAAVQKLVDAAPKAGIRFIFMLQGYFLMDLYMAGARQSMMHGHALDRSAHEVYALFDQMLKGVWSGEVPERAIARDLRILVAAAVQSGMSSRMIETVVTDELAKSI